MPSAGQKSIYLTFDDGPIPEVTPWVLQLLKDFDIKAHFFCVGDNVQKHPTLFQNIISDGHLVGNHSHNHVNGWTIKSHLYIKNVLQAERYIPSKLFRPPYGKLLRPQLKALQQNAFQVIMWDILTKDYDATISPQECLKRSLEAKNGSIVLFHDSIKAKHNLEYALPRFIESKLDEGYIFSSLMK